VQVDAIRAYPNRIGEDFGSNPAFTRLDAHVLFEYGKLRLDTPALADVSSLSQPICASSDITAQAQPGIALARFIRVRSFGLHPVQQRQAEFFGALQVAMRLFL